MTRTGRPSLAARIRAAFADPVLRALSIATLISTVGRGIALTLVVLYLTLVVGLPAEQVALVFTIGAAVAVTASYLGGQLADRLSARLMLVGAVVVTGLALMSYALVTELWQAIAVESLVSLAIAANGSVRAAIIARAFTAEARVTSRAVLRTITNVGITLGTGVAAIALALGTAEAYRAILVLGGAVYALCALVLVRLPATVDAPARVSATDPAADDGAAAAPPRRGRSPWRDGRYLLFSALSAVFAMQFAVASIAIPLWLVHDTPVPEWVLSPLLIINTVLVIALTVPLARGTHDLRRAGTVTAIAGVLMALACLVYGAAGGAGLALAATMLVLGTVLHAFAEILSQAAGWGLSFELADPDRAGAYQGVFGMGYSLSSLVAPLVITATVLAFGMGGWVILAVLFLLAALGVSAIAFRAARSSRRGPDASSP
ncbi:MAG: MFS transporter [Protaetiibacter sp.]